MSNPPGQASDQKLRCDHRTAITVLDDIAVLENPVARTPYMRRFTVLIVLKAISHSAREHSAEHSAVLASAALKVKEGPLEAGRE